MKKVRNPKLAAPVDTQRLIRDFVDAFSSLKTVLEPPTCSHPAEEEQRPEQFQEGCEQACERVGGGALSGISAEPPPVPSTPLETLTEPGSDIDEEEREQISALHGAGYSEPFDDQIEAPKSHHEIIEEFCADDDVLERLRVTPQELRALSRVSMLGVLTSKQEILFMLRQIREAWNPTELRATPPPEPTEPMISEMVVRLRRGALLNLPEGRLLTDAKPSRLGQFSVFSSALGSVKEITLRIKMMLNWRNHSSANY
jgi:hypothetical protein